MKAHEICETAAGLVSGDRKAKHGDMVGTHANIARLWSAYLEVPIEAGDVALMMVLLKVARTMGGEHNPDDYIDMAGYAGCAGEISETGQPED